MPPADRPGGPDEERADTDVFTAASADEAPTGEMAVPHPGAQAETPTSAVATAERDAPTETIPTAERESATETIATGADDTKTEAIRTDTNPKHAEPESEWPSSQWGKKD